MRVNLQSKLVTLLFILLLGIAFQAHASNSTLTLTGYLADASGDAVTGEQNLQVRLYAAASGGTAVFDETQTITFTNGFFSFLTTTTIPTLGDSTFVGYTVGSDNEMIPRVELSAVPFALDAQACSGCTALSEEINTTDISNTGTDAGEVIETITIAANSLSADDQIARIYAAGSVDTATGGTQPLNVVFAGTNIITRTFPVEGTDIYNWWVDCVIIRVSETSADVTCKIADYEETGSAGGNTYLDTSEVSTNFSDAIDLTITVTGQGADNMDFKASYLEIKK